MTAVMRKEIEMRTANIRNRGRQYFCMITIVRLAGDPQIRHLQDMVTKIYTINTLKIAVKDTAHSSPLGVPSVQLLGSVHPAGQ
jgi:hypothetical protein